MIRDPDQFWSGIQINFWSVIRVIFSHDHAAQKNDSQKWSERKYEWFVNYITWSTIRIIFWSMIWIIFSVIQPIPAVIIQFMLFKMHLK